MPVTSQLYCESRELFVFMQGFVSVFKDGPQGGRRHAVFAQWNTGLLTYQVPLGSVGENDLRDVNSARHQFTSENHMWVNFT